MSPDIVSHARRCPQCGRSYPSGQRVCPADGAALSLPDPYHLVGRTLAERYRIDALVGIGGMGAVYAAWHLAIDRRVALKILQPNIAILDERMVALFEREARTVGRLAHDNITDVFDAGRTPDGIAYMAMEWLDGVTLEDELAAGKTLTLARLAMLVEQIAAALDAAHDAQIVHRDLKPANVMLVRRGERAEQLKVLDFGIAKAITDLTLTGRSIVTGTPAYASPEQLAHGATVDGRADIYSLGVILYRALTGQLPFDAATLETLLREKAAPFRGRLRALRPDVPADVEALIQRMLAPTPTDRPARAGDVSRALSRIALGAPSAAAAAGADDVETGDWAAAVAMSGVPTPVVERSPDAQTERNPLLSELQAWPAAYRWATAHRGGGLLALVAAAGAVVAIVGSHLVGAACVRVTLGSPSGATRALVFGYAAEPNAALWYLTGVPLFIVVAAHFLNLAHSTLKELCDGERLIVAAASIKAVKPPLEAVAYWNRKWFGTVAPLIVLLGCAAVYIPEFGAGPGPAFGWVGALTVKDLEGASIRDLQAQRRVGAIPGAATLCGGSNCDVRVVKVEGGHGAGDAARWLVPFRAFVVFALTLQVLFGGFAAWIAAKILFMLGLFTAALVNRRGDGLKIELDFEDTEMRFGIGALDVVHNVVLLLVLAASVMFLLQRIANVTKGSSFFSAAPGAVSMPLVSQFVTFVVPLLPLALILIAPTLVFTVLVETEVGRTIGAIERERAQLRRSLGGATPPHQRMAIERAEEQLRRKRDLARRQRPWPRRNNPYRLLLISTFVVLVVLPFAIEYLNATGRLESFSAGFVRFSELLCWLL